jgi:hypothetical protein
MHGSYLFHFTVVINGQQADRQSLLIIYAISNVKVASFLVARKYFFACEVTSDANSMIQVVMQSLKNNTDNPVVNEQLRQYIAESSHKTSISDQSLT